MLLSFFSKLKAFSLAIIIWILPTPGRSRTVSLVNIIVMAGSATEVLRGGRIPGVLLFARSEKSYLKLKIPGVPEVLQIKLEKPNAGDKSKFRWLVEIAAKYLELSEESRLNNLEGKPKELHLLDEMIEKHKQTCCTKGFLARAIMEWAGDAEHRNKKPRVN